MKPSKSSRGWPFRIKDILQAIDKIEQYTKNMTASDLTRTGWFWLLSFEILKS